MKIEPTSNSPQFKGGMAKKIANFINKSDKTQRVLEEVNKNNALYSGAISFVLAGVLRPLAIGLFPFKDKKDKQVSQVSAVSAGLVELGFTTAIFIPLNKCIEKASKNLYKHKGSFFEGNNVALRSFKSVTNRGFKMAALLPISLLRFGLIKPIMDKINPTPSVTPSVTPSITPSETNSVTTSITPSVTPSVTPSITHSENTSVTSSVNSSVASIASYANPNVTHSVTHSTNMSKGRLNTWA